MDTYGARVLKFAPPFGVTNQGSVVASGSPYWNGIAIAANGDLYVADGSHGRVLHFAPSGMLLGTIAGMRYPAFLQFGPDGYLYATDFVFQPFPGQVDSVVRIAPDGSVKILTYLLGALGLAICTNAAPPMPLLAGGVLLFIGLLIGAFAAVAATIAWLFLRTPSGRNGPSFRPCPYCGASVDLRSSTCGKPLEVRSL